MGLRMTAAEQIARTLADPETLGARWNPADRTYYFRDGSSGRWETVVDAGRPGYRFVVDGGGASGSSPMATPDARTHTPGPWTAHDDDGTGTLPCVLAAQPTAFGNFYVAQCNLMADARLIAAAPEMLAALEATVEHVAGVAAWLDGHGRDRLARALLRGTEQARAAIRAARGE